MATNSRNTRNSSSSSSGDDYNSLINSNRTSSSSKSSLFDDLEIKQHIDIYGTCKECQYPKTSAEWCRRCSSDKFREKFGIWSSGNKDIDNFISNAQMTAIGCSQVLEWIPWERFSKIKHIGLGRFGSTYSAVWIDGYITHWDNRRRIWGRCDFGTRFVIKIIQNSSSNISDFLNELISHKNGRSGLIRCYGITQHPITRDYALVIHIAAEFNIADQEGKLKDGLSWIHPEAIYSTRHLEFQSLPEPENFSPDTYHNMVAFCARIHHTDDLDCHLDSEITDIFAISSQFSRRPSTFLNGSIASTPTNTSKESLLYRMPGAYIGSVSDGIDNTWKEEKLRRHCQDNGIFLLEVWYNESPESVIPEGYKKLSVLSIKHPKVSIYGQYHYNTCFKFL
ncbi:46526_t:CDS:2 [Gigaspora margarita]|uniref:46526_t:CDS:1 n=1 Tax=Gigaspora margarita TaxID=4874 RepID=A0ABN7UCX6_GIGMA|nr:46526_t:CDS:2 [Gigaspora margarita]